MEIETMRKTQTEVVLDMENLGKWTGTRDARVREYNKLKRHFQTSKIK